MNVTLNTDGQFGDDGPQKDARGLAVSIRRTDGDTLLLCVFRGYPGTFFWVNLKHVLWPHTENTETYMDTVQS